MARDRGSRGERWIAVHDGMPDHPKIENLSDRAFRALVTLWCHCGRYHTDGHISTKKWVQIASPSARRELLAAGLVETRSDGSVDMHDYLDWQRSASEVEHVVQAKRTAGQQGNHERWHVKKNRYDPDCKWCVENPPPPSQTTSHMRSQTGSQNGRRVEERRGEEKNSGPVGARVPDTNAPERDTARAPHIRFPAGWAPHAGHARTAHTRGLDLEHEATQFEAHARANDRRVADWDQAFVVWLGSARRTNGRPTLAAVNGDRVPTTTQRVQAVLARINPEEP